ncbi:MAG TPA: hypothetical protein DCQ51_22885 [Planktothrix sp. UBA8407]|jgi:hypothetical protein|nr:hypothetical protein [Planktothrix sp. UBA8407]HBK22783.1 hypothetical protein [Planktothrix sp. UBA10369]
MFVQLPKFIPKWINLDVNSIGWGVAIAILTQIQYPHEPKFPQFSLNGIFARMILDFNYSTICEFMYKIKTILENLI